MVGEDVWHDADICRRRMHNAEASHSESGAAGGMDGKADCGIED
jgi:hypothetical protein